MNRFLMALTLCFSSFFVCAESAAPKAHEDILAAQDKLQKTFTNYKLTNFKPSPIPGIYEVQAGSQVHYYAPEQNLLIFGQIWTSAGENLTEKSKQDAISSRLEDLPLDSAVLIQKGDIPIIEITNPDCGYCKRYEKWIEELSSVYSIERKVVFLNSSMFPQASAKMTAVVCSDDKEKSFKNMMKGLTPPAACKEADSVLASHERITDALGVQGTPTFLLPDGKVISGFNKTELEKYFLSSATKQD